MSLENNRENYTSSSQLASIRDARSQHGHNLKYRSFLKRERIGVRKTLCKKEKLSFVKLHSTTVAVSMDNTSAANVSNTLLILPAQLNIYLGLFLWTAGNLGCLGNIFVFSSRRLRERAFAIYLLAEATSNLVYFNFLLLTRILQRGFQLPISTRFDALCKIRQFDSVWNHVVSLSFFSLATIDRILALQRENSESCSSRHQCHALHSSACRISTMEQSRRPCLQDVHGMPSLLAALLWSPAGVVPWLEREMCCDGRVVCLDR